MKIEKIKKEIEKFENKKANELDYYNEVKKEIIFKINNEEFDSKKLNDFSDLLEIIENNVELLDVYIDINKNLLKIESEGD